MRVCWSFFSEDLVESYQLYYKRISNDTSKEEQTGKLVEARCNFTEEEITLSNFFLVLSVFWVAFHEPVIDTTALCSGQK